MVENLFTFLSNALNNSFSIALTAAFGWGILSILLSPCHLSGIPLIIGYISSQKQTNVKYSFYLSLIFAVGILITIAIIGVITVSFGRLMGDIGTWANLIVAALFIIVGLYLMDIMKLSWSSIPLNKTKVTGMFGALILGLLFGIGLGPCTFAYLAPVLGVVFHIANTNLIKAILLIAAFGIGHCAVIVIAGSMTQVVQKYLNWTDSSKITIFIKRSAGFLVVIGGIYFIYTSF
ncbi:MAG: cytochrome C biogenesis protein [Calditrichia bacterium]|nr:cytochrome C biogenesis protein [Calditrichia bacterium]